MTAWTAGLLLPAIAAWVLTRRVSHPGERLVIAVPVIGIAIGLASAIAFALMTAGLRSREAFLLIDAGLWIALTVTAFAVRVRRQPQTPSSRSNVVPRDRLLTIAVTMLLIATGAVAVLWFAATSSVYPHGEWDAWAQWNLRARFFFRGFADGTWRTAFAPVLAWSHADYPMLVPMSVARLWLYGGQETVLAPIAFGGFLAAATVSAAALSVAHARGAVRGCLTAALLLACPSFVRYSAAQCADVAVGFYLLAAFVLWARASETTQTRTLWIAAGLAAALAGWAKNEGLAAFGVFLLAAGVERFYTTRSLRSVGLVVAGAAPVLLVIVAFKLTLAPPSYFTSEQSLAQAIGSLIDSARVSLVGRSLARELWLTGASTIGVLPLMVGFAAVRGLDPGAPPAARAAVAATFLLLMIYAAAYLITPKDLAWQLRTSLDRLVLQIVPTVIWAAVRLCR